MAVFTNQAKITYGNNRTALSNVATGNLVAPHMITKNAVNREYVSNDDVTYVLTITNSGLSALTNITVTDNLGAYPFGALTLYPLTFVGPVLYYINGVPQGNIVPTQTTPTLTLTVPSVPANGSVTLVYEVKVNQYAPLDVGATITNEVEIPELPGVTATDTITAENTPLLAITKTISPDPIIDIDNQMVTYTFIINNYGNTVPTNAFLTDKFELKPDPGTIIVTKDGVLLSLGFEYTYDPGAGLLTITNPALDVPAATFSQDATGVVTATPGSTTIVVTGVIYRDHI